MSGLFNCGILLGLVHPGWYWGKGKTELDVIRIGDLEILTIPGELYPEIAEGGIESPEGADYPSPPIEVPPLRSQMKGKLNMIVGLGQRRVGLHHSEEPVGQETALRLWPDQVAPVW